MPLALPAFMTLLAVLWYFYTSIHVARAKKNTMSCLLRRRAIRRSSAPSGCK